MADVTGSEYDGNVTVGGPAQTAQLGGLTMTKVAVGPMDNNAYLLRCDRTGDLVLIDAADEPDRLLDLIEATGGSLTRVITTHRHRDHWRALGRVVAATGAETVAHPADADGIGVRTDQPVVEGATVGVGAAELSVIHLVGHTPGSITLRYDATDGGSHLFTGDSLFPGGVGNTHRDPPAFASLLHDVETKLFAVLPDGTRVYPGHGADTTLGTERPHLAEWRARGW